MSADDQLLAIKTLMSVAAAMLLWLCIVGGSRSTLYQVIFSLCITS